MKINKEQAREDLNSKPHNTAWKLLKADYYKGIRILVRMFGKYYFEYFVVYNGELYTAYSIIKPEAKSRRKLTDSEILDGMSLMYNGAIATCQTLLGEEVSEEDMLNLELIEEVGEKAKDTDNGKK